jgi:hypothetical protein
VRRVLPRLRSHRVSATLPHLTSASAIRASAAATLPPRSVRPSMALPTRSVVPLSAIRASIPFLRAVPFHPWLASRNPLPTAQRRSQESAPKITTRSAAMEGNQSVNGRNTCFPLPSSALRGLRIAWPSFRAPIRRCKERVLPPSILGAARIADCMVIVSPQFIARIRWKGAPIRLTSMQVPDLLRPISCRFLPHASSCPLQPHRFSMEIVPGLVKVGLSWSR